MGLTHYAIGTMKITFFLIIFALLNTGFAAKKSYIVYMGAHQHGANFTTQDLERVENYHHNFLASYIGSLEEAKDAIFYSYKMHINGFAALLEEEQAAKIAEHPEVVSVFRSRLKKLHTTHSWDFMQLEKNNTVLKGSIWSKASFGEDTIIANLDTGVWPESRSFSDEGYGAVPSKWKGVCEKQNNGVPCNKKIIGARQFSKGYIASGGEIDNSTVSPRDYDGHGSHTLSTAAGNFVPGANISGAANGTAKGGSPKARVAAYKACWDAGCDDADLMAAFDTAIHDGVDVISVSLGGFPADYFIDGLAIGAFHATQHGITVVCSAGNDGPDEGTVTNLAPWLITVGASTLDREFESYVELHNGKKFTGLSVSSPLPKDKLYPLISGAQAKLANASADDALLCEPGTLDKSKVKGKILACLRGDTARIDKGVQAKRAGAVGMILCNAKEDGNELEMDSHVLPASHLTYHDGAAVFAYINSTKNPLGYIKPNIKLGIKPAPYMADFSSLGPNFVNPEILKPDITAPGVNIIAAYSEVANPTEMDSDTRKVSYMVLSGTSMSCPHISGVAGLLKTRHPSWSPAAIKSAIMTTARVLDNTHHPLQNASFLKATPFNYGAGHVQPNRAMDPGLIYDLKTSDYLNLLCAIGYNQTMINAFDKGYKCPKITNNSILNLNYPSITVPNLNGSVTVTRTVKNVAGAGTYVARVHEPKGVQVTVVPKKLTFKKAAEKKSYKLVLTAKEGGLPKGYVFGDLTWTDGKHYVRSPITVAAAAN